MLCREFFSKSNVKNKKTPLGVKSVDAKSFLVDASSVVIGNIREWRRIIDDVQMN